MLDEKKMRDIEWKLNSCGELYFKTEREVIKEYNRGYCQGIAFVLEKIGFEIEWENEKVKIIKV